MWQFIFLLTIPYFHVYRHTLRHITFNLFDIVIVVSHCLVLKRNLSKELKIQMTESESIIGGTAIIIIYIFYADKIGIWWERNKKKENMIISLVTIDNSIANSKSAMETRLYLNNRNIYFFSLIQIELY